MSWLILQLNPLVERMEGLTDNDVVEIEEIDTEYNELTKRNDAVDAWWEQKKVRSFVSFLSHWKSY